MGIADEGGMHEQADFINKTRGHQGTNQLAAAIHAEPLHCVQAPQLGQCRRKIDAPAVSDDFLHPV